MKKVRKVNLKAAARNAMRKYGFEDRFPDKVISEVNLLDPEGVLKEKSDKIRDLRGLLWSSIDNFDSLDLDQAEYCEKGQNGGITVKVAVADVDFFAPKGSAADEHAHNNTTSVYTSAEIFPMFPDRMSTDISSLNEGKDRLAVVIEYSVQKDGRINPGEIYRAKIKNHAKLVYEEIGAWLEGKTPTPQCVEKVPGLEAQLRLQDEASQRLGDFRRDHGSLELGTIEAKAIINNDEVKDLIVVEHNQAHELIENLMVGANRVMSIFLESAEIPIIQRVVRIPRDWSGIVLVAKAHKWKLPAEPDAIALSKFLEHKKKTDLERFPDLSLTVVKLLGSGEYVMLEPKAKQVGHFCLAVTNYTHATAPNRRYVDVIIQRLLKAGLEKAPCPYTKDELNTLALWCTDREKASKKVERFMGKVDAAMLLSDMVGKTFEAFVTGSSDKGIYVRLIQPHAEGRVMRGGKGYKIGQKVRVKLINLDPAKGFIDFEGIR